jgi:hypothetical protein
MPVFLFYRTLYQGVFGPGVDTTAYSGPPKNRCKHVPVKGVLRRRGNKNHAATRWVKAFYQKSVERAYRTLRLENILVPQRPFQPGPHLHLAELLDGEVQVLQGFLFFVRVVLQ